MLCIDINSYLKQTCKWEQKLEDSEFVPTGSYADPVELECFIWGSKGINISTDASVSHSFNKSVCVVDLRVKEGDRINGLIVDDIIDYPYFSGNIVFRECVLKG